MPADDRLSPRGGGGGEPPGTGFGRRLSAVEAIIVSIDKTLAVMSEQFKHLARREDLLLVRSDLATLAGRVDENFATLSGKIDGKASAADLATLSGRVDENFATLSGKIDGKASAADVAALSGKIDENFATLSGKIDRMALATDLAELKGRVARIPTVPVLTSILLFVSLLFAAAAWALRHLPDTWSRALQ